jgi:hypothetical protein
MIGQIIAESSGGGSYRPLSIRYYLVSDIALLCLGIAYWFLVGSCASRILSANGRWSARRVVAFMTATLVLLVGYRLLFPFAFSAGVLTIFALNGFALVTILITLGSLFSARKRTS